MGTIGNTVRSRVPNTVHKLLQDCTRVLGYTILCTINIIVWDAFGGSERVNILRPEKSITHQFQARSPQKHRLSSKRAKRAGSLGLTSR